MKICIVHTEPKAAARWQQALLALLPEASVAVWPEGAGADYAVGWAPPADFFGHQPALRAFLSAAAGVDHLLRHRGLPDDLPVARLEDAGMASQMAEYCCHEVFRIHRRFDDYLAQQRQGIWKPLRTGRRSACPVGVFGLGVLGRVIAARLADFGYPVNGFAQTPKTIDGITGFFGDGQWNAFLAATRILIVMAPLTADTAGRIDRAALSRLQPGGYVVNVARGGLINDEDLIEAIDSGQLAGATLDVFRDEPLPAGHPFWAHPGIRITPHVAAVTLIDESAAQVAANIRRIEAGMPPDGLVIRARGY